MTILDYDFEPPTDDGWLNIDSYPVDSFTPNLAWLRAGFSDADPVLGSKGWDEEHYEGWEDAWHIGETLEPLGFIPTEWQPTRQKGEDVHNGISTLPEDEKPLRVVDVSIAFAEPKVSCVAVPADTKQAGEVATYVLISRFRHTSDYASTWVFADAAAGIEDVRRYVLANAWTLGLDTVLVDTGAREARYDAWARRPNPISGPPHTNALWLVGVDLEAAIAPMKHSFAERPGVSRP